MDLSIIIPCFNEVENVPKLKREFLPVIQQMVAVGAVGALATAQIEIIFVDDGSQDGTLAALSAAFADQTLTGISFHVVQHAVNRGLGAALRSGFEQAQGAIVLTTDCDGTYRFSEIPALLLRLTPEIDMVTASPYHPAGAVNGVPAYRLLLSRGSSAIYRLLADYHVYTYTALFRAYRRAVIESVPFYADGFLAGTELLVNGLRMGYRVAEYPTVLHARAFGVSKAKLVRTVRAHLDFQAQTLRPWHPYGLLLRGEDPTVYLYEAGRKRPFPSPESLVSHGYQWQQVRQLSRPALAAIPDGPSMPFRAGTLLRGADETVYIIEQGKKRPFASADIFEELGYAWTNVLPVSSACLAAIELGLPVSSSQTHPNGTLLRGETTAVYLLQQGKLSLIPTVQVFHSWHYQWEQVVNISAQHLAHYPPGEPISAQPTFYQSWRHYQCSQRAQPGKLLFAAGVTAAA
ncbi:MAG: glycosyltransferase family 2 protein [Caldilineaceae bacterium]